MYQHFFNVFEAGFIRFRLNRIQESIAALWAQRSRALLQ
jgi:hypothetical protein